MVAFDSRLIIERMKQVLELKGDKELRAFFGVAQSTFSSWKNRNSLPADVFINFANERKVDLNWLLLGVGESKVEKLASDEEMMLFAYRKLTPEQKINAIAQMSGLGNSTNDVSLTANGNDNNQQIFHGSVGEVIRVNK